MSDITIGLGQTEKRMLPYEVSDEALESAAGSQKTGNYTLAPLSISAPAPKEARKFWLNETAK